MTLYAYIAPGADGHLDPIVRHQHSDTPITYRLDHGILWRKIGHILEGNDGYITIRYFAGVDTADIDLLRGEAKNLITGVINTVTEPGYQYQEEYGWHAQIYRGIPEAEHGAAVDAAIEEVRQTHTC